MKILILLAICLPLTFNAFARETSINLESRDGTQIRLTYDVVSENSNKPYVSAKNIKVVLTSANVGFGDIAKVVIYQDLRWGNNSNPHKTKQSVVLFCYDEGYCKGVLPKSLRLMEYMFDIKHWLQVDINGRYLVDPYRNSKTFRAILSL